MTIQLALNLSSRRLVDFILTRLKKYLMVSREVLYGLAAHEMDLELRKERGERQFRPPFYACGLWRSCWITFASPLLFDEAFALHHSIPRDMEKKPVKGKRPDRFCSGGSLKD